MKADAIICTKDPANIRPMLLEALKNDPSVKKVVIETSSPLSAARVAAARNCDTDYVAYFDDDTELPPLLVTRLLERLTHPGILAVSTQAYDVNPHWLAYRKALLKVYPNHHEREGNFDNRAYIIRRDFAAGLNPPECFYCEDEWLYQEVRKHGRWVHLPFMGVWHYGKDKPMGEWGYWTRRLRVVKYSGVKPLLKLAHGIFISFLAVYYSRSLRTLWWGTKRSWDWTVGYYKAWLDGY